jgi:hypothetical protein
MERLVMPIRPNTTPSDLLRATHAKALELLADGRASSGRVKKVIQKSTFQANAETKTRFVEPGSKFTLLMPTGEKILNFACSRSPSGFGKLVLRTSQTLKQQVKHIRKFMPDTGQPNRNAFHFQTMCGDILDSDLVSRINEPVIIVAQ